MIKLAIENVREGEWVELAYAGKFIHPLSRKSFELSQETFEGWEKYFRHITALGNTFPIAKIHSVDPLDRLGTVQDVQVKQVANKSSFWVKLAYKDDATKEALKDSSFSVFCNQNHQESDGTVWKYAFHHVGVTDYPVIRGLQKEIAASSFIFENDLALSGISITEPKPERFIMKSVALELGLPEDADEATTLAALKVVKAIKPDTTNEDKMLSMLVEERKKKIKTLNVSDEQKTKLEKFCTPEQMKLELSSEISLFDTAFEALSSVKTGESFKTGPQDDTSDSGVTGFSILEVTKQRAGVK